MGEIQPILFNTDMVRAILDGRKTVTRRLVKPQPWKDMVYKLGYCTHGDKKDIGKYGFGSCPCGGNVRYVKPPFRPGDLLYVRETIWQKTAHSLDVDGETRLCFLPDFRYCATDAKPEAGWNHSWTKRPSIHMPKEAARIWLEVTDVRVERLQDIDDNGIVSEGLEIGCDFENIWKATVRKPDLSIYGWDANPWVWVIEFERCEKPGTGGK